MRPTGTELGGVALTLEERDDRSTITGRFEAVRDAKGGLAGTWTSGSGKRVLPFRVAPWKRKPGAPLDVVVAESRDRRILMPGDVGGECEDIFERHAIVGHDSEGAEDRINAALADPPRFDVLKKCASSYSIQSGNRVALNEGGVFSIDVYGTYRAQGEPASTTSDVITLDTDDGYPIQLQIRDGREKAFLARLQRDFAGDDGFNKQCRELASKDASMRVQANGVTFVLGHYGLLVGTCDVQINWAELLLFLAPGGAFQSYARLRAK